MATLTEQTPTTFTNEYFGIPVMVQLRIPMVMIGVSERQKLPHATDPKVAHWIPSEVMEGPEAARSPVNSQLIRYAILRPTNEPGTIEMLWLGPGPTAGVVVTLGTLVNERDIAFVTRAREVPDGLPLIHVASS